jgi:predicted DNA-binding transcriptional regulator AlpA
MNKDTNKTIAEALEKADALVERLDALINEVTLLRMGDGAVLSYRQAAQYVGLSKATFDLAMKQIPRVRLSQRRYGFLRSDIDRWLADNKEFPEDADPEDTDDIAERAAAAARGE